MTAACGQSGNHAPHTYWNGSYYPKKLPSSPAVKVMVACNGNDPQAGKSK